jgi:outer membrane protein TolC
VGTILELTDAQLALPQAQNTEAQALADYRIAVVRLERAVGQRRSQAVESLIAAGRARLNP